MVREIARFTARPGKTADLRAGLVAALAVFQRAEGCRSIHLLECIEEPDTFIYEIDWETLDDHLKTFRDGPLFAEYRGHIAGLFVDPVHARHYTAVN